MSRGRSLVLSALLAVVAAGLFGVFVVRLLSRNSAGGLAGSTFNVNAAFLARQVRLDGPVLFQDLLGGDRDIYVQHLSDKPAEGWIAVKATAPGQPRTCTLTWDKAAQVFRDTRCATGATFPPDGTGLEHYKTYVQSNKLIIDFR